MAKKLADLTKKEWSRIKKVAGIEKNKKLFRSDASVGKYVKKFEKARKSVERAKTQKNVVAYLKAMDELETSFGKFLDVKDLSKDEGKSLEKEMKDWIKELKTRRKNFKATLSTPKAIEALKSEDKKELDNAFDQFIL